MTYRVRSVPKFEAEFVFSVEGKEELLEGELKLLQSAWPSISYELGVELFWIVGNHQLTLEAACDQFLSSVKRHEWWVR